MLEKTEGLSRMDNPEILTTFDTQNKVRRQKQNKQNKTKNKEKQKNKNKNKRKENKAKKQIKTKHNTENYKYEEHRPWIQVLS